ncbi:MAG TPA: hypothetical protein VEL07_01960 [Planctomycetota bacterium]|nr:hypothetical protein [Planctomycetota bacterium]
MAKLYHRPPNERKARKLTAMVRLGTDRLKKISAWPLTTLHEEDGTLRGFLMPFIEGRREIHHLTSPPIRKHYYPQATWAFQIHVARNLAAAIDTLHDHRIVIGDINEGGFLVGEDGTLRVIDCDSFQFTDGADQYLCEVGIPDYTPPELHAAGSFDRVVRTVDHDRFGLAVIVFKLLFQGRHPFMGRFTGDGEPDLARFISEFRFAYGRTAILRHIAPPPFSLGIRALPRGVSSLFERAFSERGRTVGRPTAEEWHTALTAMATSLVTCRENPAHRHVGGPGGCPWCALEEDSGIVFFYGRLRGDDGWECDSRPWQHALKRLPELVPVRGAWTPARVAGTALPPDVLLSVRLNVIGVWLAAGMLVLGGGYLMMLVTQGLVGILGLVGVTGGVCCFRLIPGSSALAAEIARRRHRLQVAESACAAALDAVRRFEDAIHMGPDRPSSVTMYVDRRSELEAHLRRYANLEGERREALAAFERGNRQAQLRAHLDGCGLRAAKLPWLKPVQLAILESSGVATAGDIERAAIETCFGTESSLVGKLLAWQDAMVAAFRFDATKPSDPYERGRILQRFRQIRGEIERDMRAICDELTPGATELHRRHHELLDELAKARQAVDQARGDVAIALAAERGVLRRLAQAQAARLDQEAKANAALRHLRGP